MASIMAKAQEAVARFLPFLGPAFFLSVGYMDPGNWATAIEAGSGFGYELVWVVVLSNVVAFFLQSLATRLGLVTGKHLAQICREEYSPTTAFFLWFLCELSIVAQDLTMVLGIIVGLDLLLHFPMLASIVLMAADAMVYLLICPLLEVRKAEMVSVGVVGVVLVCFLLHIPLAKPPVAAVLSGVMPRLRRDSLYSTIGLFGANMLPHNLYLHSCFLQGEQKNWMGPLNLIYRHNLAAFIVAIFAALMVNLVVLMAAASTFHNAGLVVLTLQDAYVIMEQILNNSMAPVIFGLALICAGQLSAFTGMIAGKAALDGFLQINMHGWQHRFFIRLTAIAPAAICVWRTGSQGTYQLLIFSQVFLALQLPFTVVPLIKVTSSPGHMGAHRNSLVVQLVAWILVAILFFLDTWLVSDILFGESDDWVYFTSWETLANLDWSDLSQADLGQICAFSIILVTVSLSMGFLVWMIIMPLRVDSQELRRQLWIEEYNLLEEASALKEPSMLHEEEEEEEEEESTGRCVTVEHTYPSAEEVTGLKQEMPEMVPSIHVVAPLEDQVAWDSGRVSQAIEPALIPTEAKNVLSVESSTRVEAPKQPSSLSCDDSLLEESVSSPSSLSTLALSPLARSPAGSAAGSSSNTAIANDLKEDVIGPSVAKRGDQDCEVDFDADIDLLDTHEDEVEGWENLEGEEVIFAGLGGNFNSRLYEGTGSGRSVGGRSDTSEGSCGGSGSGSLSRLSGLGRAARKQFAAILDEFWGKFFDFHGQPVTMPMTKHQNSGTGVKHRPNNFNERGRMHQYVYGPSNTAALNSSPFGHSPDFLGRVETLHSRNERPYSSMKLPTHPEEYDYQPATIHGYQSPSFMNRSSPRSSPNASSANAMPQNFDMQYVGSRALSHSRLVRLSDFEGRDLSSPSSGSVGHLQNSFEGAAKAVGLSGHVGDTYGTVGVLNVHSTDRKLSQTERHLGPSDSSCYGSSQWNPRVSRETGRWDRLVSRATGELDMGHQYDTSVQPTEVGRSGTYGNTPVGRGEIRGESQSRSPLAFDEISPSQLCKEGFSMDTTPALGNQSLWSTQPFEQLFGMSDGPLSGRRVGRDGLNSSVESVGTGRLELEVKMFEDFRACIGKLLSLEGSGWLFRSDNGSDEDLIAAIASHERLCKESEAFDAYTRVHSSREHQHWQEYDQSVGFPPRKSSELLLGWRSVAHCSDNCVWGKPVLISFGVWCIHRVLELSLMESRPELWGKYTYVLNRLQGILEPVFGKPRVVPVPCLCLLDSESMDKRCLIGRQGGLRDFASCDFSSAFNSSNSYPGSAPQNYPHPWSWGRNGSGAGKGKEASASVFLEMIKEVEAAVGSRKGRTGTAAGDVAFPKGKENLASVLKRYKRRLTNKPTGAVVGQGAGLVGGGGGRKGGGALGLSPTLFFAASVCVLLFSGPTD